MALKQTNKKQIRERERKRKKEVDSLAENGKEQSHSKNDLTSLSKKNIHLENMLQIGTMKNIQVIMFFSYIKISLRIHLEKRCRKTDQAVERVSFFLDDEKRLK